MRNFPRIARVPALLAVLAASTLGMGAIAGDIGWPLPPKPVVNVAGSLGDIGWPLPPKKPVAPAAGPLGDIGWPAP
ncbi:hypothetical protein ACFQ7J_03280 [Streptomyces sp. NPDC056501]|uniref:hypothetical protein n=1 Tax=Streptomyces sp. NPDC056501 TaxID=3345841 RepID=UPI0036966011